MLSKGGKILFENTIFFRTFFQKANGLMFSKKISDAYIFVFKKKRRMDMHMVFVFFPIDVIFLDEEKNIIELKKKFLPFTFYYSKKEASYVIEMPSGSIERFRLMVGDKLEF